MNDFKKINQIEIDKEYAFISVSLPEPELYETEGYIGVDLTTTVIVLLFEILKQARF